MQGKKVLNYSQVHNGNPSWLHPYACLQALHTWGVRGWWTTGASQVSRFQCNLCNYPAVRTCTLHATCCATLQKGVEFTAGHMECSTMFGAYKASSRGSPMGLTWILSLHTGSWLWPVSWPLHTCTGLGCMPMLTGPACWESDACQH